MAKGLQKHQERVNALNYLGKDLTRRAHSKCELCEAAGVPLTAYEVPPVPAEPDMDHCLMVCKTCSDQLGFLQTKPKRVQADHWRCLGKSVWSSLPVAQVVSVRVLQQLENDHPWASEILEMVYLEPDIKSWVDAE